MLSCSQILVCSLPVQNNSYLKINKASKSCEATCVLKILNLSEDFHIPSLIEDSLSQNK